MTSVIRHTVKAESEIRYEAWLKQVTPIAQTFRGQGGVNIVRRSKGSRSYTSVLHFDTIEHLGGWLSSDARKRLLAEIASHLEMSAIEGIDAAHLLQAAESFILSRLLGSHVGLLQISGVCDADGRISFERTLESQLLCPFAYLRKHLLAEQTDAGHGILMRNVPIVAPDRHNAWARFFQQVTNARQHLLRRPAQDHAICTLFFERRVATWIFGATYRELDEIASPAGREIA